MKPKNIISQNLLLDQHAIKSIVIQAHTLPELKKKVKEYELALVHVITSAYRISELFLENNGIYYVSPTGNYQSKMFINFKGKIKERISKPEETLKNLEKLTAIKAQAPEEFNLIKGVIGKKNIEKFHSEEIMLEIEQEYKIDEEISNKQREFMERLILNTNLTDISFNIKSKQKEPSTGKIIIILSVQYKYREIPKTNEFSSNLEEPEDR